MRQTPPSGHERDADLADAAELLHGLPARVGPYRILGRLGQGGMGLVLLAEQDAPLRRRVALKILKPGMDSVEILGRFELERQALALMTHPGIAAAIDGGATDDGRPYFVMEQVAGAPITQHCDEQRMDVDARLRLFAQVCGAIQHAHHKGIVHRDIKPSNVLVSTLDGQPLPKVIDFGIAKVLEGSISDLPIETRLGAMIGTPDYMSPEQAVGQGDIDSTTDIFSLGVLLYELLAGVLPIDPQWLRGSGPLGMLRMLADEERVPPSRRLRELGTSACDGIAAKRSTTASALLGRLSRDLDWIALRALELDRSRRYASASELAADVERHLAGEAVLARPPTPTYRMRKFAGRHRAGVLAAALVCLALVGGLAGTAVGLLRARKAEAVALSRKAVAEQEAAKAKAITSFLQATLASADPFDGQRDAKVVDVLARAAKEAGTSFQGQPEVEAAVRHALGVTLRDLGKLPQGNEQLEAALAIRTRVLGAQHLDTLATLGELAGQRGAEGKMLEAAQIAGRVVEGRRAALGPDHPDTLTALADQGTLLYQADVRDQGEALLRQVVEKRTQLFGTDDPRTLVAASNLAGMLRGDGKLPEAEGLLRRTLEAQRRQKGPRHSNTLFTADNLAQVLEGEGKLAEAEQILREIVPVLAEVMGRAHTDTLGAQTDLAIVLCRSGKHEEAEALYGSTTAQARDVFKPDHWLISTLLRSHGNCRMQAGRYAEAEAVLLEAVKLDGGGGEQRRSARKLIELYKRWNKPELAKGYAALAGPR